MHTLLPQLQVIDKQFPLQRKLLLVPSINFGRELLASLAHVQGSWVGWETATVASIAERLAIKSLAREQKRRASDVVVESLVSRAFDEAARAGELLSSLAELSWSAGTRSAFADAVLELRAGNVPAAMLGSLDKAGLAGSLGAVLRRYEGLLAESNLTDASGVIASAVAAFDAEAPYVLNFAAMMSVPNWTVRGGSRLLLEKLHGAGLRQLDGQARELSPERGTVTPGAAMFCASTPADEIREVVRRALSMGASLDQVEIACTNRDLYGITIDTLCEQLGISSTMLDGVPLAVTRLGRAVERWLTWLESGHHAAVLREALEAGDLESISALPDGGSAAGSQAELFSEQIATETKISATQLAAELRKTRLGWGLDATRAAARALKSASWLARLNPLPDEPEATFNARRASRLAASRALAGLLEQLVSLAPAPRVGSHEVAPLITVAELAARTTAFLALVPARGAAELATRQRLVERMQQVASVGGEPTSLANAIATFRQHIADLRAWTETSNTRKPRRATGGHLHLTSIDHAGATGRPFLFIVGLDADSTAGPVLSSTLLPDALRVRLNERGADLPTTAHRRKERAANIAYALGCSDSTMTLSYALRTSPDGREAMASHALLAAARVAHNDATMSHATLRQLLGTPVSAVPANATAAIDTRDVWLSAMADGSLLLDATDVIREGFPSLNCGMQATESRGDSTVGAHHGLVPSAARLDPRITQRPISPSSLERLAMCGLRWFYGVALGVREPDDPVYDALVWLNALDRGTALHLAYERIMRDALHTQTPGAARNARVDAIVRGVAIEMAREVPPPSDVVRDRETQLLLEETLLFVAAEHDAYIKEPWDVAALESQFGDANEPAVFALDDGTELRIHGRVDRVDRLRDGSLRLVDYKTGRAFGWKESDGVFDGGRKLQLALYSPAISARLEAVVTVAEYRFTTARGDGSVARADAAMIAAAPQIVRSLLDDVSAGRFLPTMDQADCAYCEFSAICRVSRGKYSHTSPRASWAAVTGIDSVHYAGMRNRRGAGEPE